MGKFREMLDNEPVVVFDGAMGTLLYSRGIYINQCYDALNLSNPSLVSSVHREYFEAGAEIIETNTFGANPYKLKVFGMADKVQVINYQGAKLAREAADGALVAGAVGPLGVRIEPWGKTSIEEAEEAFKIQIEALLQGGVDLIVLETFMDLNEIHTAINAIKSLSDDVPVVAQMTIQEDGNSLYGTTPEIFGPRLQEWGADVVGVNCSVGPNSTLDCIEKLASVVSVPLIAQPNAGRSRNIDGRFMFMGTPEYLAEFAKRFIYSGVRLVGGCCGTTPDHIRAISSAVHALHPEKRRVISISQKNEDEAEIEPLDISEKSRLGKRIADGEFVVMAEIVPPRGTQPKKALKGAERLVNHGVHAINIPDGPRASARISPMAMATLLKNMDIEPILHYCCRDRNLLGMQSDMLGAWALGLKNLLLITGDPPKLGDYPFATGVFDIDSIGLVNMVSRLNRGRDLGGNTIGSPTGFLIGVGANPGAMDPELELKRFAFKVEAGAEFAITQPVFDIALLEKFLERIDDFRIPVFAGIWPLTSLRNAEFMNAEVPGAHVPEEIMKRMRDAEEGGRGQEEGLIIASEMLEKVRNMVQGAQISVPFGRFRWVSSILGENMFLPEEEKQS